MRADSPVLSGDLGHWQQARLAAGSEASAFTDLSEQTACEGDPEQAPLPAAAKEADVAPDGGYGWVIVACVALINAHTWGVNSSYGVFLAHYLANNTYPGSTALDYAFVGGLSIAMSQVVAPIATTMIGKYGTRTALVIGIVLQTAALLGASWSTQIWQLFLSQGICFGWGMGFQFNASVGVVPQWFDKKRSFANSIGTAGSGLGGLVYSLAANAIIQSLGLGWAFRILAIASCAVNAICAILLRDRNKAVGSIHKAFDFAQLKKPEFLFFLGWGFFSMTGYVVLLFSLPNYAQSVGLTAEQGSVIGALMNLGQAFGRPAVGYFSDVAGRINISLLCTFLPGFFCLVIWIFAKSYGVLIFFALLGGAFAGTFWTTVAPVGAEVIGLQMLPSALSIVWMSLILPSTFAEVIALELRTNSGEIYLHAQVFTGFMYITAAICMWFIRIWKIAELDKAAADLDPRRREAEIKNDDMVPKEPQSPQTTSVAVNMTRIAKGQWTWRRV